MTDSTADSSAAQAAATPPAQATPRATSQAPTQAPAHMPVSDDGYIPPSGDYDDHTEMLGSDVALSDRAAALSAWNTLNAGPARHPGDRIPPHDILAEQSVLGAMLMSPDAVAEVISKLRGSDFYVPKHEVIYNAILSGYSNGEPTDVVSIGNHLVKHGLTQKAGGVEYLHELTSAVPTASNAEYYAEIVDEKSILRRLVLAGTRIAQMGYAEQGEAKDLLNLAQVEIYQATGSDSADDYVTLKDAVNEALEEIERAAEHGDGMRGISSGFRELDELTNGFTGGQMVIVAARPAMGKSTLALDIARAAAIGGSRSSKQHPTIFFSLEMGSTEIATRLIAAQAEIPMNLLKTGQLEQHDWQKVAHTIAEIDSAPLYIDDSPNITMVEIRAKCRRLSRSETGLGMVVIDYLQLLSSGKKAESRQQEVSEFSRSLKLLAKELNVPVIALAQLNRASEQRSDKKPHMSDLRESGSLEQDADMVILLHREFGQENPRQGEADLILAKQRNGPTGTVTVAFQGHFSRFRDMAAN